MKIPHVGLLPLSRRHFLWAAAATSFGAGAGAAEPAQSAIEVIGIGPAERPRTDLEAWNVGLITASRPELSARDNQVRNRDLWNDLSHFGRLHLRGRYVENDGTPAARSLEIGACLVIGNPDDSGNLKGMLRKIGRKYQQDAVIHKGYYRDAELNALKDISNVGMSEGANLPLGRFHPNRLGAFYTLMTRCASDPAPASLENVGLDTGGADWLGGRWDGIGLFTPRTFLNPSERRIHFDEAGNRYEA